MHLFAFSSNTLRPIGGSYKVSLCRDTCRVAAQVYQNLLVIISSSTMTTLVAARAHQSLLVIISTRTMTRLGHSARGIAV